MSAGRTSSVRSSITRRRSRPSATEYKSSHATASASQECVMAKILRSVSTSLVLVALLLAACGGGGDAGAPLTPTPGLTLTAPANFSTGLAGTVSLAATPTTAGGVSGVEFQVDGAKLGTTVATAPYATSLDTTPYASGQHVIRARTVDAAGNPSDWASATVSFG